VTNHESDWGGGGLVRLMNKHVWAGDWMEWGFVSSRAPTTIPSSPPLSPTASWGSTTAPSTYKHLIPKNTANKTQQPNRDNLRCTTAVPTEPTGHSSPLTGPRGGWSGGSWVPSRQAMTTAPPPRGHCRATLGATPGFSGPLPATITTATPPRVTAGPLREPSQGSRDPSQQP
jgi:hypothetical protein